MKNNEKQCAHAAQSSGEKQSSARQSRVNKQERFTTKEDVHLVSVRVSENKDILTQMFGNSSDIKMREMILGKDRVRCLAAYIEITAGSLAFENSLVGRLLNDLSDLPADRIYESLADNGQGLCDVTPFDNMEDAVQFGMLTGDVILFIDGFGAALKIPDKGDRKSVV